MAKSCLGSDHARATCATTRASPKTCPKHFRSRPAHLPYRATRALHAAASLIVVLVAAAAVDDHAEQSGRDPLPRSSTRTPMPLV